MAKTAAFLLITIQVALARSPYHHENEVVGRRVDKRALDVGTDRILLSMLTRMWDLQKDVSGLKIAFERHENSSAQVRRDIAGMKSDIADIKSAVNDLPKKNVCPKDFTYMPAIKGCYNVVLQNLNWAAAQLRCRSLHKDAHLVFVNSANEQKQIASMLARYSDSALENCFTHRGQGKVFWTGGQRIDPPRNPTFVWKKNLAGYSDMSMSYTSWRSGEPNNRNHDGSEESCLELSRVENYKWNDDKCSQAICSVCELDL